MPSELPSIAVIDRLRTQAPYRAMLRQAPLEAEHGRSAQIHGVGYEVTRPHTEPSARLEVGT